MSEIETAPLATLASLITDKVTVNKDPLKPYVGLEHIPSNGSVLLDLGSGGGSISTNNVFKVGDILFGKLRPGLRKSVRVNFEGYCSTDILVLRPNDPNDAAFVSFVLRSDPVFMQAVRTEEGTKMPRCSWKSIKDLSVFCPRFLQQARIAEILSTVNEAIEQTEALITKYQQIKAGLMQDLFTRGITSDGHLRPSCTQAPHLYKSSPLGWIPKEWKFGVLDGFSNMHNNLRKPISAEVRETIHGEYPYYGPTGILDYINEFLIEGEFCLIGEDGDHFLKFAEWPMTILVEGRFNVNNHAHILSGRNGATTRWLHAFFLSRDITFHLTRQGAGRFKLNKAALKKLPICVPDPAEQYEILDRIEAAQSSINAQNRQLGKLRQQKHGLMHDLLTGRVRVKVAETASIKPR